MTIFPADKTVFWVAICMILIASVFAGIGLFSDPTDTTRIIIYICCAAVSFRYLSSVFRKYILDSDGMLILWFCIIPQRIPWSEFKTLRVCKLQERPDLYKQYILFSKDDIPFPMIGKYAQTIWYYRHARKSVLLPYSEERFEEIKTVVPDLQFFVTDIWG